MHTTKINFSQQDQQTIAFPVDYNSIWGRVEAYSPENYARSRNYIDGAVSYLSPYISRGVISTKQVYDHLREKGFKWYQCEKFVQELAWRDYWQLIWNHRGESINEDLKHEQPNVRFDKGVPEKIITKTTEISAIDDSIEELETAGYMHNHVRMYTASIICNIARYRWQDPARWMYYHLLDGDWASNALSWQWVAGSNSFKKYFANQENINRYCHTNDERTILDRSYEDLASEDVSSFFIPSWSLDLTTKLPEKKAISLNFSKPTLLYNSYNLDPLWRKNEDCNRILVLEPSHFEQYPVSDKVMEFVLSLSRNIEGLQIFVGELSELQDLYLFKNVYYKEHPLNKHYPGLADSRDWLVPSFTGEPKSFFNFWKKIVKELRFD